MILIITLKKILMKIVTAYIQKIVKKRIKLKKIEWIKSKFKVFFKNICEKKLMNIIFIKIFM